MVQGQPRTFAWLKCRGATIIRCTEEMAREDEEVISSKNL